MFNSVDDFEKLIDHFEISHIVLYDVESYRYVDILEQITNWDSINYGFINSAKINNSFLFKVVKKR